MASIVDVVLDQTAAEMERLPALALSEIAPVLRQARAEAAQGLKRWLETAPNAEARFTAQRYRSAIVQLDQALETVGKLQPAMMTGLKRANDAAEHMAPQHVARQLREFGKHFDGAAVQLPFGHAVDIKTGRRGLIKRFETSAARYAGAVGDDIRRELAVGLVKGETIGELTTRLQKHGGPRGQVALRGIAGQPGAVTEHIAGGLFRRYEWWADRLARTECLIGDTRVDAAVISAVHRRHYQGSVVEVVTERGRKLTATPNHPMLTRRGWVGAGELTQGDDLVGYDGQKHPGSPCHEHVAAPPATIAQIFDSLAAVGVRERRRTAHPDFHGDGADGYVDILRPLRALRLGSFAALYEPLAQLLLAPSNGGRAGFCSLCRRLLSIDKQPCLCSVSGRDASVTKSAIDNPCVNADRRGNARNRFAVDIPSSNLLSWECADPSRVGRPETEGIREAARHPGGSHDIGHPSAADVEGACYALHAEARAVEFDRVLSLRVREFSGHVFNLSTPFGYFSIDGIYTGNTINAYNIHADASIAEAHKIDPEIRRIWNAAADKRLCPTCRDLDGKTAAIGKDFPGGYSQPPAHPNCRCALAAWRSDWS